MSGTEESESTFDVRALVRESRAAQRLPETVEDEKVLAEIAAIIRAASGR